MDYSCLENIIGITQSDCDCVVSGLTNATLTGEWYKQSASGLYMDEQEGMISISAMKDSAECNEMATFYYNARANAIKQLGDDLLAGLQAKYKRKNPNFSGKAGTTTYSGNLSVNNTYAGDVFRTPPMKSGYMKFYKVWAMMNATVTFNIEVYQKDWNGDTDEYELVQTIFDVQSQANTAMENVLTEAFTLYMSEFGRNFYFLYQPAGLQPKSNTIQCGGCGGNSLFKPYAALSGITGNDLSLVDSWPRSNYANGLAFQIEAGCDTKNIVCEMYNSSDAFQKVMSYAIRFRADAAVLEKVYKSGNVNRYTMMSGEAIQGTRNTFNKQYNDRLAWLIQNADPNLIGCFVCNNNKIRKSGILV